MSGDRPDAEASSDELADDGPSDGSRPDDDMKILFQHSRQLQSPPAASVASIT